MCANRTLSFSDLPADIQGVVTQIKSMMASLPKEAQDEILNSVVEHCRSVGMPEASIQQALRIVRDQDAVDADEPEAGVERVEIKVYTAVIDGREVQVVPLETFEKVSEIAQELGEKIEKADQMVMGLAHSLETVLKFSKKSSDANLAARATTFHAALKAKLPNLFE